MSPVERFDPKAFISTIPNGMRTKSYRVGEVIFAEGDKASSVFFVKIGRVRVTVESEQRRRTTVAVLGAGQFFGEASLSGVPLRNATTTAMIVSTITEIPVDAMTKALSNQPAFAQLFIAYLIERSGQIESDFRDQLFNSSEQRLVRLLIQLSHSATQNISPDINQEMLSELIGTTRPRVNGFLIKLRRLGLISYGSGGIEVKKKLLNIALPEKPQIKTK